MNIIKTLTAQAEKGMTLVDIEGNILSLEKIKKRAKKIYADLIKKGEINPIEKTFSYFLNNLTADFLTVYDIIDFIRGEEQESEHEPEEGDFREMHEPFEQDEEEIPE